MKKTKFAVLLTAFMAVLGLSSCLGEPDPYVTGTEIMKVEGFMGFYSFKSSFGYTVEPTNSNVLTSDINSDYAWVTYKYDTRTTVINENNTTIDAEIQYLLPISEISLPYEDVEPNIAIHTASESVKFYDKYNIFIDLAYYYKSSSDNDELRNELAKHSFYFTRATAEEDDDVTNDTMVFNLIHQVTDSENNEERRNLGSETRHFNLQNILQGSVPEKIIIKFKQNSSSASMDNALDRQFEIEYKDIVDKYFNN